MSSGSFSKLSLDHFDFWSSWRYLQSAAITEDRKELPAAKERRRNDSAGEWNGGIQVHCYTFWVLLNCFLSDLQGFLKPITGRNLKIFWAGPTFSLELAAWNHKREDVEWTAGASTGGTTQEIRCGSMIFTLQSWSYTGHFRFIQIPGVQGHITEHLHRWARHGLQVVKHNRLWEWNSTKRCGTCRLVDLNPRPIDDRGSTLITLGNSEQTLTSAVHFFFKINSEFWMSQEIRCWTNPSADPIHVHVYCSNRQGPPAADGRNTESMASAAWRFDPVLLGKSMA